MKRILTITLLVIACVTQAQELPSEAANGFAFPIGSKFTIKLIPEKSGNYNYSIIAFEPFEEIVDLFENDTLFEEKGEENTIVFYFCLGTRGETDQEREKNMQVLLLLKNYSKEALNYTSEIQVEEDGEYKWTSNVGTYPNVKTMEMWRDMIYSIGLRDFKKMSANNNKSTGRKKKR